MRYLYLDESGDLGHDLKKGGTSRYFVITVLEISSLFAQTAIEKAVDRTLKNKVHRRRSRLYAKIMELKASHTELSLKRYFFRHLESIPFNLYSVIVDKKHFIDQLQSNKSRAYDFVTHLVLKTISLEEATISVSLVLDRSKSKKEIQEFDSYFTKQLQTRIQPRVPLVISHNYSHENRALQAVDLFAWGIRRKYEVGETLWYDVFRERIAYEQLYPFI